MSKFNVVSERFLMQVPLPAIRDLYLRVNI